MSANVAPYRNFEALRAGLTRRKMMDQIFVIIGLVVMRRPTDGLSENGSDKQVDQRSLMPHIGTMLHHLYHRRGLYGSFPRMNTPGRLDRRLNSV